MQRARSFGFAIPFVSMTLAAVHCGGTTTSSSVPDASEPAHDSGARSDSSAPKGDAAKPTGDASKPNEGDAHGTCTPGAPTSHRASASTCSTSRPPSQPGDAGAAGDAGKGGLGCMYDSQCTEGTNGRCMPLGQVIGCSYDECTTDDACPANNLCQCGTATGEGRTANTCVPSNCRVDSDCGAGGSCSPSYGTTCGALFGVVGYFCHKAADECTKDECVNDSDCTSTEAGPAGSGYCAWDPTSSAWSCFYGVCAG